MKILIILLFNILLTSVNNNYFINITTNNPVVYFVRNINGEITLTNENDVIIEITNICCKYYNLPKNIKPGKYKLKIVINDITIIENIIVR